MLGSYAPVASFPVSPLFLLFSIFVHDLFLTFVVFKYSLEHGQLCSRPFSICTHLLYFL